MAEHWSARRRVGGQTELDKESICLCEVPYEAALTRERVHSSALERDALLTRLRIKANNRPG
jgi:hypothetical protein